MLKILLNRKIGGTCAAIGVAGLCYFAGYETNKHYGKQIEKAKQIVASELSNRLGPEAFMKQNMEYYKRELVHNPAKYKDHIVDISLFGIKEYPTDIFVKGVRYGIDYVENTYKKNSERRKEVPGK